MIMRMIKILLFCAVVLLGANNAYAQSVNVRTGAHADYSRLVFDWTKDVTYSLDRTDKSRLLVTFVSAANFDTSKARANPVANISGLEILASNPAKVANQHP